MNEKIKRITELVMQAKEKRYIRFELASRHIQLVIYNKEENDTETNIYYSPEFDSEGKLDEMIAALEKFLGINKIKVGEFKGKNIYIGSIVEIMNADRETEQVEVDYDYTEMGAVGIRNGENVGWLSEMIILDVVGEE